MNRPNCWVELGFRGILAAIFTGIMETVVVRNLAAARSANAQLVGRLELHPERFDIQEMIASVERVIKGVAADASVRLRLQRIDPLTPPLGCESVHISVEDKGPASRPKNCRRSSRSSTRRSRPLRSQGPARASACH